eukprot:4699308-Prymnesium_polylepis.1
MLDLGNPPGATGDGGLRLYASSLQPCNPLIEIYPYTPFPPSQPKGFSYYTSEPSGWTPPTRADAAVWCRDANRSATVCQHCAKLRDSCQYSSISNRRGINAH